MEAQWWLRYLCWRARVEKKTCLSSGTDWNTSFQTIMFTIRVSWCYPSIWILQAIQGSPGDPGSSQGHCSHQLWGAPAAVWDLHQGVGGRGANKPPPPHPKWPDKGLSGDPVRCACCPSPWSPRRARGGAWSPGPGPGPHQSVMNIQIYLWILLTNNIHIRIHCRLGLWILFVFVFF